MPARCNRIFNIGLNRAGTTSLTEALCLLGIRAVHHKHEGTRLYDIMRTNVQARRRVLEGLDMYDAFSDFAGRDFYRFLDRQYPYSRFILTTRDLESWLDSRERKVEKNLTSPHYHYSFRKVDREGWVKHREEYLADLDRYFEKRKSDLLIINIPDGDGWEKLCPFLGVPIPDLPFPFRNRLAPEAATA
ncbi:MAG: sulfotransferase family protein [Gammaproteobacteria bacterium]